MSAWETISEEASIVLVGNLNPSIFHPEWFIRKGIVEEWDYSKDIVVNLPDMSKITFPSNRQITVLLNQFVLQSSMASDHLALKDIVTSTFSFLKETPITQMGMNYSLVVKIHDNDKWAQFGSELAPKIYWEEAVNYVKDLDEKKQAMCGLYQLTMNLPRSDEIPGHIRPSISAINLSEQTLKLSVNNHVEIDESGVMTMVQILEDNWEKSLSLADNLISNLMRSQLENIK